MDSYANLSSYAAPRPPQPKQRANDIFNSAIGEYEHVKTQLKPEQSVNFVCYIGGGIFDVYSVTASGHYFEIRAKDGGGNIHIITVPVEQIAFDIIVSKKVNDEPPREIGFKPLDAPTQKQG
jgi:hypothetical protein